MLSTYVTEHWGLRYPILGAPMAYVDEAGWQMRLQRRWPRDVGIGSRDSVDYIEQESAVARGDGPGPNSASG